MYLEYFKFTSFPFSLTPNIEFFCHLKGHQEALNTLLFSLSSGEGFIKIIGEVGSGKTLLCRKLLESLDENYATAYIPNPDLSPIELRRAVARELGVSPTLLHDNHELQALINNKLIELNSKDKKVVLLLDEAQAIPSESLETIRLLTNLETANTKLLQVILFGQPELDEKLNQPQLRQLKQRICFSFYLPLLNQEELDTYLFHRLATAGHRHGPLFTKKARKILYRASNGIPRLVNIFCHKALLIAYGKGDPVISDYAMKLAIKDSEVAMPLLYKKSIQSILLSVAIFISLLIISFIIKGLINEYY